MAEVVFFVHGKLCHRFPELWQQKNGIVAKAAGTALFGDDLALAPALSEVSIRGWMTD